MVFVTFPGPNRSLDIWQQSINAFRVNEWRTAHISDICVVPLPSQSMPSFVIQRRNRGHVMETSSTSGSSFYKQSSTMSIFTFYFYGGSQPPSVC
jgi:hypothetical protein